MEESGRVADDQKTVSVVLRNREVTALRDGLCPIVEHLPAFEHRPNSRMLLEFLEEPVRVCKWILVVETDDQPYIEQIVLHAVDKSTTERIRRERITEGMHDSAGFDAPLRKLPDLLDSRCIDLRIPA